MDQFEQMTARVSKSGGHGRANFQGLSKLYLHQYQEFSATIITMGISSCVLVLSILKSVENLCSTKFKSNYEKMSILILNA